MNHFIAIGIMSGTSVDGIDSVLFSYHPDQSLSGVKVIASHQLPYTKTFRQNLLDCIDQRNLEKSCELGSYWAQLAIESVQALLKKSKRRAKDVDVIASHGQTLLHHPAALPNLNYGYTLQIGYPSFIAQHTGITCVGNFRQTDIALGGQGAPLLPTGHFIMFKPQTGYTSVHNLGGISNLSILSPESIEMAYDTGPANMWIDLTCRLYSKGDYDFDENGEFAHQGRVHPDFVQALLKHPYFNELAPKSTGYETLGKHHLSPIFKRFKSLSLVDAVASATEATAISIAQSYQKDIFPRYAPLNEIIFSGGGCFNMSLISKIQQHLDQDIPIKSTFEYGCAPHLTEAIGFGLLGIEFIRGKINVHKRVTGASQSSIGGEMAWGSDAKHIDRIKSSLLA